MDEPQPIDLSALDPARAPARWELVVLATAARARARRATVSRGLVRWAVPAVVLAAAAAVAIWIAAPARSAPEPIARSATEVFTGWVTGAATDPFDLLELGGVR